MKIKYKILPVIMILLLLTSCTGKAPTDNINSVSETVLVSEETTAASETELLLSEERESDKAVCDWLYNSLTDSEEFPDKSSYQYYARTLGLEKDFFLSPTVWEVFYNEEININKEIDDKEIYLIRLNPYVLLDIYAKRNNCTVDELCKRLSCSKEQLYYNWGYDPNWRNYDEDHADLEVSLSKEEIEIFGASNGENRISVMSTHVITVDTADKNLCTYSSSVSERLKVRRMDILSAVSEESRLYSEYSEAETSASIKENGIGIRAVIPLSIPNAWHDASEADMSTTPFINVSPYAYGCHDSDKIEVKDNTSNEEDK